MKSLIGQALTHFIPPHYRMCNPEATSRQLVAGFFVMNITASITCSAIPKSPPLLNRITLIVPVALLEVSKCVGWVFTAQYVYVVALSLLLGRSWLVKAVVLGISQGVISSLMKTAITAIFWSKRAHELEEAKKKWNQFLEEHPIIPLQGTIHHQFSKVQVSFFENAKKLRALFLERLKNTKNQEEVECLREEIKRLDCGNNVLTRFIKGGSFPIPGREFLELKEQIRSMVFDSIGEDKLLKEKERRLLGYLQGQYEALLKMQEILDSMQNKGRELSKKNDTENLKAMHNTFSNMESSEEWRLLEPGMQQRLSKMRKAIEETQSSPGSVVSIESFCMSSIWDHMMETARLANANETLRSQDWWININNAVNRMKDLKGEYLVFVALNNCIRELIQRGLEEASSMPTTERLMMSMCTVQAVLHLLTRYPAFSSFPILVDAIICLLSEFMNQLRAPGLPHVVETLGKIEPLQKALAPLEEVMNGIAGLQKEFEAILPEEAKDPASQ